MTQLLLANWIWFYLIGAVSYLCGFMRATELCAEPYDWVEGIGNAVLWPLFVSGQLFVSLWATLRWSTRLRIVVVKR